jgi:hypothetical protein
VYCSILATHSVKGNYAAYHILAPFITLNTEHNTSSMAWTTGTQIPLTAQPSPITTETVALAGRGYDELRAAFGHNTKTTLLFHCRDPERKGMSHVEYLCGEEGRTVVATPSSVNVRSAVHEYGGGSYIGVELDGGASSVKKYRYIIYTDFSDGHKLCAVPYASEEEDETEVIQIYPPTISSENDACPQNARFADFEYDPHRQRLLCIMEDHTHPEPANVENSVVSVSLYALLLHARLAQLDTTEQQSHPKMLETLAKGNDFYSTPKLSPDGTALAFVTWNHPHMPWFVTELCIQPLHPDGNAHLEECFVVQGDTSKADHDEDAISVSNPMWDPTHHKLYFLSDATNGYYNLYMWDGVASKCIVSKEADFTDGKFGWMLGTSPYVIRQNGTLLLHCTSEEGAVLVMVDPDQDYSVTVFGRDVIMPSSINSLCLVNDADLYFLGGSPSQPVSIWKWNVPESDETGSGVNKAVLVVPSIDATKVDISKYTPFISAPQKVMFPNRRGTHSYGYFYPPNNRLSGESERDNAVKPPLLVKAHGGPTSSTSTTFRLGLQYWTSRGFAILDVDYGGSLGYGRKVRC